MTVQVIQGLEKFPIQYWNNPGEKNNLPLKDLAVASFFFKSAYKVLESQRLELYGPNETPGQVEIAGSASKGRESLGHKDSIAASITSADGLGGKLESQNKANDGQTI